MTYRRMGDTGDKAHRILGKTPDIHDSPNRPKPPTTANEPRREEVVRVFKDNELLNEDRFDQRMRRAESMAGRPLREYQALEEYDKRLAKAAKDYGYPIEVPSDDPQAFCFPGTTGSW